MENQDFKIPAELKSKTFKYFQKLCNSTKFKDTDGKMFEMYLNEEKEDMRRCKRLEHILSFKLSNYISHLVVGAGTGGLIRVLKKLGVKDVFAVEPNSDALNIAREKARLAGVNPQNILAGVAEALPFPNESMEVIHCHSVIEHVQDMRLSIKEMYRVLKPEGFIYIGTTDYRTLFEHHYRTFLPLFLGKKICKIILWLRGRPTAYLDTINFVTERKLNTILLQEANCFLRIYEKSQDDIMYAQPADCLLKRIKKWLIRFYSLQLSIQGIQQIIIKKGKS